MIEELDAIQRLNLSRLLLDSIGLLLVGIVLEIGLHFGKKWALAKNYTWLAAILGALNWQPLFWGVLLGTVLPLLDLTENTTGWQRGPDLIWTLVMISVTIVIVRLINGLLRILTATTPSASVSLLNNVLAGLGVLIVAAIIFGFVFDSSPLVLLLAVLGAITGLTVVFQEPLKNLVSGVSLTISKRLSPGDWIRLPSGIEGHVTDIQWDVTMVQQFSNNILVVPNYKMTDAEIINYDLPNRTLAVPVTVGVSYDSNLAQVEQITREEATKIMKQINGQTPTPEPIIRYNAFADFRIDFDVYLYAASYAGQFPLKHEFIKRLHQRFDDEGIVIPLPIRTLHTRPDQPLALASQTQPEVAPPPSLATDGATEA